MPLVSVIMGVYNCKNYKMLEESVLSIVHQTFTDWEFIICNDGSTNNTENMLNQIENLDSRIRIISYKKNKGLSTALNMCIQKAKGKYIARQDDDDISYPNRLEVQVDFLNKNPEYAIVGCIADVYDDNGIWGEYNLPQKPQKLDFLWNNPFAHPTVVMRKEALTISGNYRVAKETKKSQDYDLFMRMYANGYVGYNIQTKLYKYRIENGEKKHRPMRYRIDEAKLRYIGFRKMNILLKGVPFIFKPVVIGLIPQKLFKIIRKSQY